VLTEAERAQVRGRAFVTKKLKPLPIEAIVRGYLVGSGWKDYKKSGAVCGIPLPPGLQEAQKLPQPLFTPSSKAAVGEHDENISFEAVQKLLGPAIAEQVKNATLALYTEAANYALTRGIIIADTKFEFGVDSAGKLYLIDEAITPDSSRFWPADQYQVGSNPPSFDKQFVRDWLESRRGQRGQAVPDRRGHHARFFALLAGRPVPGRQQPAQFRQTIRARLARIIRLEQATARSASSCRSAAEDR